MPTVPLGEIVDLVGGRYVGNRNRQITTVAPLAEAAEEHLSFLSNRKYVAQLAQTKAGAILVPKNLEGEDERWIRVDDPYFAIARIMTRWFSARPMPKAVSPRKWITSFSGAAIPWIRRPAHFARTPDLWDAKACSCSQESELQTVSTLSRLVVPGMSNGTPAVTMIRSPFDASSL